MKLLRYGLLGKVTPQRELAYVMLEIKRFLQRFNIYNTYYYTQSWDQEKVCLESVRG